MPFRGPDGAEVDEFGQEMHEVGAHLGRIALEGSVEVQRNLGGGGRLCESLPDEGRHLVQGVDRLQVADLAADRHEDGLAGNDSGNKFLRPPIPDARG